MNPGEPVLVLVPLPGAVCLWGRQCTVVGLHEGLSAGFGQDIYCVRGRDGRIAYGPAGAFLRLTPSVCAWELILGGESA